MTTTGLPATTERPYLRPDQLLRALSLRDLTDPAQGPHAVQLLLDDVLDALRRNGSGWTAPASVRVVRDSPLVSVEDNYDRLGFGADAVTRDARYSRYVGPTVMLRSHTSASMPAALRTYADAGDTPVDELVVAPGLVYRRDSVDATHVGEPHQVDLWRLRSAPGLGVPDLRELVAVLVEAVLPGARWRTVPAVHPYTREGLQVDVRLDGDWLELAECGLVAPGVLIRAGLDPRRWSGLALGMGLDRALMLRKGIPDVRALRSDDPRIAVQMLDLTPWRPVSWLPPVRRDLSLVLDEVPDDESLGDAVREALGEDADDVEQVSVLAVTPYADLPDAARDRLRLRPDQVNALVRLVLRPLGRTLTDAEANAVRNRVYTALHRGEVSELA